MNGRLDELLLGHELPVALFSYYQSEGRAHASWTPFCGTRPSGSRSPPPGRSAPRAWFIDLPAWSGPSPGCATATPTTPGPPRGRVRPRPLPAVPGRRLRHPLGPPLRAADAPPELAARLAEYFAGERGEEPPDERDGPREAFMARWIGWASPTRSGTAATWWPSAAASTRRPSSSQGPGPQGDDEPFPAPPRAAGGRPAGSYLVPYSFQRLDSFAGYESGMPSPAFYDALWEEGPEAGAALLLRRAVERLRARRQPVSAADLIAARPWPRASPGCAATARPPAPTCSTASPARSSRTDLDAPLPWSYRGTLRPRTDPLLVEVMAAFSGETTGRLAPAAPRPPLVAEAESRLAEHGLAPERASRTRGGRPRGRGRPRAEPRPPPPAPPRHPRLHPPRRAGARRPAPS